MGGVRSVGGVQAVAVVLIVEGVRIFEVTPVGGVVLCGVVLVATVMREVLNVEVGDILFNSLVKGDGIFISLIIQTVVRGVLNSTLRIASPALLPLRHSSSPNPKLFSIYPLKCLLFLFKINSARYKNQKYFPITVLTDTFGVKQEAEVTLLSCGDSTIDFACKKSQCKQYKRAFNLLYV